MDCDGVRVLLLILSGVTLGSWLGFLLGYSSRYGVNQVSLMGKLSGVHILDLRCTITVKFLEYCDLLYKSSCGNSIIKEHNNCGQTWPVSGFRTRETDNALNIEWPRYIPKRDQGSHWSSSDILPCYLASKTLTEHTHVWCFLRVMSIVLPAKFFMGLIPSSSTSSKLNYSAKAFKPYLHNIVVISFSQYMLHV